MLFKKRFFYLCKVVTTNFCTQSACLEVQLECRELCSAWREMDLYSNTLPTSTAQALPLELLLHLEYFPVSKFKSIYFICSVA